MGHEVMIWNLHWALALAAILPLYIFFQARRAPGKPDREKFHKWAGLHWLTLYGVLVFEIVWVGVIYAKAPDPFAGLNVFTWIAKLLLVGIFVHAAVKVLKMPLETHKAKAGMAPRQRRKVRDRRVFTLVVGTLLILAGAFVVLFVVPWAMNGWAWQGGVKNPKPGADLVWNMTVIATWGWVIYGLIFLLLFNVGYPALLRRSRRPLKQRRLMRSKKIVALTMVLVNIVVLTAISLVVWTNILDVLAAFFREGFHLGFSIPGLGDLGEIDFLNPDWLSEWFEGIDTSNFTPTIETPEVIIPEYNPITGGEEAADGRWPPSWWPF